MRLDDLSEVMDGYCGCGERRRERRREMRRERGRKRERKRERNGIEWDGMELNGV